MHSDSRTRDYRPELLSRRGELTTWVLGLAALAAWLVLALGGYRIHLVLPVVAVLLIFAAMGISLGNWMDRHSLIRIKSSGIEYRNGLRHTRLEWSEIVRVEVFAHKWGDKVRVLGESAHFDFRTLGEVEVHGEIKGRMGFMDGDYILQTILQEAHMKEVKHDDTGYYYVRE
jgi:hypothetical protein